ncbi:MULTISPECIES: class I SAM-dependent methyltransferase [unclassified Brachybacterium]|uniref:class I SAM-dependent methyltransferase n=1 Tax=unclassified Brachybacterium TaxID=2623841 RepID=UPI00360A8760
MTSRPDVRILDHRTPQERDRSFLPGIGRAWLMPLYDIITKVAGAGAVHRRGAELAGIRAGESVLDVGCGTGNFALTILGRQHGAQVTGLDPDGGALRRAARKARRRGFPLTLIRGYADRLPVEDSSLDHIVSALALHHVEAADRARFAAEALRALRPGGTITIADFDGPRSDAEHEGGSTHGSHAALGSEAASGHGHGRARGGGRGRSRAAGGGHGHPRAGGHGPAHAMRHLLAVLPTRRAPVPTVGDKEGGDDNGIVTLLTEAGFDRARELDHIQDRTGRVSFVQATHS